MEARISLVTLAVADLARARRFYVDGLGWAPAVEGDDVVMIQTGDRLLLSLWARASFEAEVGPIASGPGLAPVTIAHNCRSAAEVDAVLEAARAAGADPVAEGEHRAWGGYSGYFADPDGFRWEVAWAPGPVSAIVAPDADPA